MCPIVFYMCTHACITTLRLCDEKASVLFSCMHSKPVLPRREAFMQSHSVCRCFPLLS